MARGKRWQLTSSTIVWGVLGGIAIFAALVARETAFGLISVGAQPLHLLASGASAVVLTVIAVVCAWRNPRAGLITTATLLVAIVCTWIAIPPTMAPELLPENHPWISEGMGHILVALQRTSIVAPLTFATVSILATVSHLKLHTRGSDKAVSRADLADAARHAHQAGDDSLG